MKTFFFIIPILLLGISITDVHAEKKGSYILHEVLSGFRGDIDMIVLSAPTYDTALGDISAGEKLRESIRQRGFTWASDIYFVQ